MLGEDRGVERGGAKGKILQLTGCAAGLHVQERVCLKDCQVGPSYVVCEGGDFKGEVLAKK